MKKYYIYEVWRTGVAAWDYVETEYINDAGSRAKTLMYHLVAPGASLYINSACYGNIESAFDYDVTLVPGLMRHGRSAEITFNMVWLGDKNYALRIDGYNEIRICNENPIIFYDGDKIIAKISDSPMNLMLGENIPPSGVKLFEIDDEYIPILEILGAFIKLKFAL